MKRRRGFTLIEVLAAVTTGAVIMGLAVATIIAALRGAQRHQNHWVDSRGVDRLARQFRADVRAAESVRPGRDKVLFVLETDDSEIAYAESPEGIRRSETVAGRPIRHEAFRLLQPVEVELPGAEFKIVRMWLLRQVDSAGVLPASRAVTIEAALGRDHRFESSTTSTSEAIP